jgi:hypothetical protein
MTFQVKRMLEREPKSDSASQRNGEGNHTAGRKKKAQGKNRSAVHRSTFGDF